MITFCERHFAEIVERFHYVLIVNFAINIHSVIGRTLGIITGTAFMLE